MHKLINAMKAQAAMQAAGGRMRLALVSSYDPSNYSAKVRIQPEDVETGWLPISSDWVGNGWGMFCPPTIGDMVEVHFQEGDFEAGIIGKRLFNDSDRPLSVTGGEFWLVHQSGSMLKFHNDGTVQLVSAGTLSSSAPQWNHTGNMTLTGDVLVTGNISDQNGTKGTLQHIRDNYDVHTHTDPQGGSTGTPSNSL